MYNLPKPPMVKKPRPPLATRVKMGVEAAGMAANALDVAPVVPTTNMQSKAKAPTTQPMTGMSGVPSTAAPGMSSGTAINVNPNVDPRRFQQPTTDPRKTNFIKPGTLPIQAPGTTGQPAAPRSDPTPVTQGNPPPIGTSQSLITNDPNMGAISQGIMDQAVPPSNEELYDRAIRALLEGGPRNTSADEKLIRDQMLKDVGAGQANLNARMAASGFGTSGALGAMGTDMRARAALEAAKGISQVRQDARDEYLQKLGLGLRSSNEAANTQMRKTAQQAILDAIAQMQKSATDESGPNYGSMQQSADAPMGLLGDATNFVSDMFGQGQYKEMKTAEEADTLASTTHLKYNATLGTWDDDRGNHWVMPKGWKP